MDTQEKIAFEKLLTQTVENKALGLHLSAGNPPILKTSSGPSPSEAQAVLTAESIKAFVFSFLDSNEQAQLEKNKEITVVHDFKPQLRFKVNIFYQKSALSATFVFISPRVSTLAELGLPQVEKIITPPPKGAIIISGSFSSGKSTVTAAIIEALNSSNAKHIITLEDPIEFVFTNKKCLIEQRQIGKDVKSFAQGLDFLAQEQVDVIVLSEIDEPEPILAALEVASSGRLVIFQINADSSVKTTEKLIELFPSDQKETVKNLLAENLTAIINLHLIKKFGGGNVLAPEILIANSAVRSIIREGRFFQLNNILQTGVASGMVSLQKSLQDLVAQNIITPDEAEAAK